MVAGSRMAASVMASSVWLKVAAVAGASGVGLAAYGAHGLKTKDPHFTEVWRRANSQQMYHAALLAVAPLAKRPNVVGALASAGILLFSGSCYLAAANEDRAWGKLAPYGGFAFMAAWLALAL
ncbi:MAG: hypothetical protein J3K34DRAFT_523089 [Monoraphidium minutum]|nr:MAG: hypothetical protein J3K34DRAFT_523089 [Monoraphidium minutum]